MRPTRCQITQYSKPALAGSMFLCQWVATSLPETFRWEISHLAPEDVKNAASRLVARGGGHRPVH